MFKQFYVDNKDLHSGNSTVTLGFRFLVKTYLLTVKVVTYFEDTAINSSRKQTKKNRISSNVETTVTVDFRL